MRVIGLTGGVGTGKTTVSQFLQELGAVLLDADKIGHETYLPGTPAWADIVAEFGEGVLQADNTVDRKKLGAIVFADSNALKKLNAIVHPRLRDLAKTRLDSMKGRGVKVVVLEAALLLEAKWDSLADEVWVTDAPEDVVIDRVQKRNGWTEEQVRSRIRVQMPREERCARAAVVVDTSGTLEQVKAKVQALWKQRLAEVR